MQILRHPGEVLAYIEKNPDPCISALIQQRMEELANEDAYMEELVVFVILESGDGIEQLQIQLEIPVVTNSGHPLWEVIEEHATCYELVFVLSSSGYGALVFTPKIGSALDILDLCREHAYRNPPCHQPPHPSPQTPPTEAVFLRLHRKDANETR